MAGKTNASTFGITLGHKKKRRRLSTPPPFFDKSSSA
jgi:hypothetical protein